MRVTRLTSIHNNQLGRAGVAHLRALHATLRGLRVLAYVPPATVRTAHEPRLMTLVGGDGMGNCSLDGNSLKREAPDPPAQAPTFCWVEPEIVTRLREVAERQGRIPDPDQLRADLAVAADRARPLTALKDTAQAAYDAYKASTDPTRRRADAATVAALKVLQDDLLAAKTAAAGVEAVLRRAHAGVAHFDGFVQARADAADALLWLFRAAATDPATLAQDVADAAAANAATRQTRTARKKAKRAAKAARRVARQATADVDGMTDVDVAIHAFGDAQTRLVGHAIYLYLPLGGTKGHARRAPLLYLAIRHTLAEYLTDYNKRSVRHAPLYSLGRPAH